MYDINRLNNKFSDWLDKIFFLTIYVLVVFSALLFPLALSPKILEWFLNSFTMEKIFGVFSFFPPLYNWLITSFPTETLQKCIVPFLDYGLDPLVVKETVCKILIMFLLQLMIVRILIGSQKIHGFGKGFVFILLFVLYAVISTFYITPTFYTAFKQLMLLVTFVSLFYIIYSIRKDRKFVEKILFLSIFISLLLSLIAIVQFLNSDKQDGSSALGFIILHTRAETYRNSVGSFIGHNTGLSAFLLPNLLMCVIFLFRQGKVLKKMFVFVVLILGLITLFLAQSRAIWLLSAAFLPITFIVGLRVTKKRFSARALLIILIVILIILLLVISQTIPNKLNKSVLSLSERLTHFTPSIIKEGTRWCILNVSVPMLKEHLILGAGLSSFPYLYLDYQGRYFASHSDSDLFPRYFKVNHSHNEYLQLLAEFGLIAVIILIIGVVPYIRDGYRCVKGIRSVGDKLIQVGLGLIIAEILVQSVFDFPWHIVPLSLEYVVFFAIFASGKFIWNNHTESIATISLSTSLTKKIFYAIIFVCVFFLSIYFQIFSARELIANSYININGTSGVFLDQGFKRLTRDPDDKLGLRYFKRGKEELLKGLKIEPLNKEGLLRLGIVELQLGNASASIDYIKKAIEEYNPKEAYNALANCYYKIGDIESAKKWYNKVIYYVPRYVETMDALSRIYLREGKRDKVISLYKQIYKWDEMYFNKNMVKPAFVSYNNMDFKDATDKLGLVLEVIKDNPDYYYVYAKSLAYEKEYEKAIKVADILSDEWNKNDLKEIVMGDVAFVQNNWEKALEHYLEAVKSQPENFDLYILISIIFKKQGNDEKFKEYMDKAYEISGENPEVWSGFGKYYYFILDEKEEGRKYFIKRLNYPNIDIVFANVIVDYYIEKEEYSKAYELLEYILVCNPSDEEANKKISWLKRVWGTDDESE